MFFRVLSSYGLDQIGVMSDVSHFEELKVTHCTTSFSMWGGG